MHDLRVEAGCSHHVCKRCHQTSALCTFPVYARRCNEQQRDPTATAEDLKAKLCAARRDACLRPVVASRTKLMGALALVNVMRPRF